MRELGGARQRQRDAARVALDLDREMEDRADQHDALFARAERRQRIAQPAQRERVVDPAMRVEHREQRGLLAARDRAQPASSEPAPSPDAPSRPRRSTTRAFARSARDAPSRLSARSSSNVSNTASRQPARTSWRSSSPRAAAHSVSTVTRATSS
jgi:hypothetical protein